MKLTDYDLEDTDYLRTRFLSTYVISDNKFYQVCDIDRDYFYLVRGVREAQVEYEEVDINTPPLGYCIQTNGVMNYLTRKSARYYKQGLCAENIYIRSNVHMSFRELMWDDCANKNLILGQFAYSDEQKESFLNEEFKYLPLSNSFCLRGPQKMLQFRGANVGHWQFNEVQNSFVPELFQEFSFLEEMLSEETNGKQ